MILILDYHISITLLKLYFIDQNLTAAKHFNLCNSLIDSHLCLLKELQYQVCISPT